MDENRRMNTRLIHAGISTDRFTGSVNIPIYQTSTFRQEIPGVHKGYEYSRTGNPTREALESQIAELENGNYGFAFASGLAAITAVLSLFRSGDRIIISDNVYGGTYRLLEQVFSHFQIGFISVDTTKPEQVRKAAGEAGVKALFIETPTNPLLHITDLEAMADIASQFQLLTIVDNTFFSPYLQRPLEHGADIVLHSATKYLGGHSDLIAGLVVVRDQDLAERIGFIQNASGGVLSPFDSFLLIRGLKTLGIRMDRHMENAERLASYLHGHPSVKRIYYPGLKEHPGSDINRRQASGGGALISFELTDTHDINEFFRSLKVITLAESLGGVESLVCHPSSMTHAAIPKDVRDAVGITDTLIRFSVGIEDYDDLKEDLEQAIAASETGKPQ